MHMFWNINSESLCYKQNDIYNAETVFYDIGMLHVLTTKVLSILRGCTGAPLLFV